MKTILAFAVLTTLFAVPVLGSGGATIEFPSGSVLSLPQPPGTMRVDVGDTPGTITIDGVPVVHVPANSVVVRHPNGITEVTISGFVIIAPVGATLSVPSAGVVQVLLGATGGTINVNGANLITISGNTGVVFNADDTTTAFVAGTSVTMPTSNGPIVADNGNATITVTLPSQPAVTIPANGGDWFAVLFNTGGGSNVPAQIIENADTVVTPTTPVMAGFVPEGWYSNAALTTPWNFGTNTVSSVTNLYVRWAIAPIINPPIEPPVEPPVVLPPQVPGVTPPVAEPPTDEYGYEYENAGDDANDEPENGTADNRLPIAPPPPPPAPPMPPPPPTVLPPSVLPPEPLPPPAPPTVEQNEPAEPDEPANEYPSSDTEEDTEIYMQNHADATEPSYYNTDNDTEMQDTEYAEVLPPVPVEEYENAESYIHDEPIIFTATLTNVGNPIDDDVSHFRIINRATIGLRFLDGEIPAFTNGDGRYYTIRYRTNLHPLQRTLESNVYAGRPHRFASPTLQDNEVITEISIELSTIPAGFWLDDVIVYRFEVLDSSNAAADWRVTVGEESEREFIIAEIFGQISNVAGKQSSDYVRETWANLQLVISDAQAVINNPYSTLQELEAAHALLLQAINELSRVREASVLSLLNIALAAVLLIALILLVIWLVKYRSTKKPVYQGT